MGYELSKPQLRAELEADLKRYMYMYMSNNNYCIVYYRLDTEAKPKINNDDSLKSPYPNLLLLGRILYYNNVLQL